MIDNLKIILQQQSDPTRAQSQQKYMKDHFVFYGLLKPTVKELTLPFLKESLSWNIATIINTAQLLFHEEKRECAYIGVYLLTQNHKRFSYAELQQCYPLINTNPWWDSVDALQKFFSLWIQKHPEHLREVSITWNDSPSLWQKRSALILQLGHKQKLDTLLLSEIIISNKDSSEFFIQKAIGWILREYSKTNKIWVREFIIQHPDLSNLSKREASKYLS